MSILIKSACAPNFREPTVVEDDGFEIFDRRETREEVFLMGVVGDDVGVVLLSSARLLFLTAGLAASVAAQHISDSTLAEDPNEP